MDDRPDYKAVEERLSKCVICGAPVSPTELYGVVFVCDGECRATHKRNNLIAHYTPPRSTR